MQDRITPCIIEEQSSLSDMVGRGGLRELVDLSEQLAHGSVRIHDVADRIASLLSRGLPEGDDFDDDDDEHADAHESEGAVSSTTGCGAVLSSSYCSSSGSSSDSESSDSEEGREVASHTAGAAGLEEALLVAGYTDCMREALRYLVEEESYAAHDPLVVGLRQHLLDHQPRLPSL